MLMKSEPMWKLMTKYLIGKGEIMKKNLVILLAITMLTCLTLVGCSAKNNINDVLSAGKNVEENEESKTSDASRALADRAKAEGVSVSEMENMIEELTRLTAEKYGDTYDNYVATLETDGKTPFDEFSTAADYMGISIKEYYEYEANKPALSEEDQAIVDGMQDAMDALEGIDLEELEAQTNALEENAHAMANEGNNPNGDMSSSDFLDFIKYEVKEVSNEENSPELGFYGLEYTSEKEVSDIVDHFKPFLSQTSNYFIMDSSPGGAIVSGTINEKSFDVSCERNFDENLTYVTIYYNGAIENTDDSASSKQTDESWFDFKLIKLLDDNEVDSTREYVYTTTATPDEFKSHFESILSSEIDYAYGDDGFGPMHYCKIGNDYYRITFLNGVEYNEMLVEFGSEPLETDDDLIMFEITHI